VSENDVSEFIFHKDVETLNEILRKYLNRAQNMVTRDDASIQPTLVWENPPRDQPWVSVVTPVYNAANFLQELHESLEKQTIAHHVQWVTVNDGSTDESLEMLCRIAKRTKLGGMKVLNNPRNLGASVTLDNAVKNSDSQVIAWISADDAYVSDDKLEKDLSLIGDGYDLVFSTDFFFGTEPKRISQKFTVSNDIIKKLCSVSNVEKFFILSFWCFLGGSSSVFKKDVYESVGGFDINLFNVDGDFDLFCKMILSGARIGFSKTAVFTREGDHRTSKKHSEMYVGTNITRIRFVKHLQSHLTLGTMRSSVINTCPYPSTLDIAGTPVFLLSGNSIRNAPYCYYLSRILGLAFLSNVSTTDSDVRVFEEIVRVADLYLRTPAFKFFQSLSALKLRNDNVEQGKMEIYTQDIRGCSGGGSILSVDQTPLKTDARVPEHETTWVHHNTLGITFYQEGELDKALEHFQKALKLDPTNDDVLFNLSKVLFEKKNFFESWRYLTRIKDKTWEVYDLLGDTQLAQNNIPMALHYYSKAAQLSDLPEMREKFEQAKAKFKRTEKIAIFCLPGLDNFIKDIAQVLSNVFEVKLVVTRDGNQIVQAYKWADIVWLEWANELAVEITNKLEKMGKKIVCRLHSYEALTNAFLGKIDWRKIDALILVAEHMKEVIATYHPKVYEQIKDRTVVVYNGLDLNKFKFKPREKGYNIAVVAHINYKKDPAMWLQVMGQLVKIDPRYNLSIAGDFQDLRYHFYFTHLLKETGLEKNVVFQGYVKNIEEFLEDKNFVLSTSVHESFGYNIAEAMACGIKPLVHNFCGSESLWPKDLIFNFIDEIPTLVSSEYNSEAYRRFVENRYSLEKQISEIFNLLVGNGPHFSRIRSEIIS